MKCSAALALLLGTTACGEVGKPTVDAAPTDPPPPPLLCSASKPFGAAIELEVPNPAPFVQSISLVSDELTAYVSIGDSLDGNFDLYRATRSSKDVNFSKIEKLAISTSDPEPHVAVSRDGTLLVFSRSTPGPLDLYESAAATPGAFTSAKLIAPLSNTDFDLGYPYILGDASKTLYFTQYGDANDDIYVAARANNAFLTPMALSDINTAKQEVSPALTIDAKEMVFSREGQLYLATRASLSDRFSSAALLDADGQPVYGAASWISDDGCRLYYAHPEYNNGVPISNALYMRSRQ